MSDESGPKYISTEENDDMIPERDLFETYPVGLDDFDKEMLDV